MILSFSISCSNEDKTGGTDNGDAGGEISNGGDSNSGKENGDSVKTKHELEGTWVGYDEKDKNYKLKFTIDSDGNVTFYPKPYPHVVKLGVTNLRDYIYTGKVETNSIVYPYTNDVTCDYSWIKVADEGYGKFIFSSPSNCTVKYDRIGADNEPFINEKGEKVAASMGTISTEIVEFTKQ